MSCNPPTYVPERGPISERADFKSYLESNKIPEIMQCIIGGLMVEQPQEYLAYIDRALRCMECLGIENVRWDSLVREVHPLNDPVRRVYIQREHKVPTPDGVVQVRDFWLPFTHIDYFMQETERRDLLLPFTHIDYFMQSELDDK